MRREYLEVLHHLVNDGNSRFDKVADFAARQILSEAKVRGDRSISEPYNQTLKDVATQLIKLVNQKVVEQIDVEQKVGQTQPLNF